MIDGMKNIYNNLPLRIINVNVPHRAITKLNKVLNCHVKET